MLDRLVRGAAIAALLLPLEVALAGDVPGSAAGSVAPAAALVAPPGREQPPLQAIPVPVAAAPLLAHPARLLIPSLSLDAAVEAVGVDRSGAMDTPGNVWNVGWYSPGPSPGDPGDAVIDGHLGLPGRPLVFAGLAKLAIGADVVVVLADGSRNRFSVTGLQAWPASSHPDGLFSPEGAPRLSLITCDGAYQAASQTYADRLVVEAKYSGPA